MRLPHRQMMRGAALVALLASCAPPIDGTPPRFPFAKGWHSAAPGAPRLMDNTNWWRGFDDQTLNALVERGLSANPDLGAARARVTAAQAAARAVGGEVAFTGGVTATGTRGKFASSDTSATADLGFEVLFDPGRGREAEQKAARAQAGLAQAQSAGARLFLLGEIANAYLQLRNDQTTLTLSRTEEGRQRQTLGLAQRLESAGEATQIDTLRARAQIASLQASLPALEAAVAKDIARISVLVGDAPGTLPPDLTAALRANRAQPRATLAPDPGVPADLVRNRPDIQVAEARYDAARAALGQTRSALYPRLSLSGTIETDRLTSGKTVSAGSVVSVGPALRLPALPQRATRASVDAATAEVEAAHADWTSAVLTALYEVEAALIDYRSAAKAEAIAAKAVSLHAQTLTLMRSSVAAGETTLSELISVESAAAESEKTLASARFARAQTFVYLNQRLGAGAHP